METDSSRLKDRMETMNLMIDEIQEKLYEFEQNKKNNLIFHGVLADHPETSDGYRITVGCLIFSRQHFGIITTLLIGCWCLFS